MTLTQKLSDSSAITVTLSEDKTSVLIVHSLFAQDKNAITTMVIKAVDMGAISQMMRTIAENVNPHNE